MQPFIMLRSLRPRQYIALTCSLLLISLLLMGTRSDLRDNIVSAKEMIHKSISGKSNEKAEKAEKAEKIEYPIRYKSAPELKSLPIKDNFPLAVNAKSPADIPPVPSFNAPPKEHVPEATPLFIGFTRNWPILQQAIVGYITAGWPPGDIYVVDNTGTMNSNKLGKLSLQNPFYLDYYRLTKVFGVNVVNTPALLNFAQLQNFFISYSLEHDWSVYAWGHMDVSILADEEWKNPEGNYKSLYMRFVDTIREASAPGYQKWAAHWYGYDRLVLVNTTAYVDVGAWDSRINFYMSDCDFHERIYMNKYNTPDARVGHVFDVNASPEDLLVYFKRKPAREGSDELWGEEEELGSQAHKDLRTQMERIEHKKNHGEKGRNTWHTQQTGGEGEPFYIPAHSFQEAFIMMVDNGRDFYNYKWGHRECALRKKGLKPKDAYQVLPDWK